MSYGTRPGLFIALCLAILLTGCDEPQPTPEPKPIAPPVAVTTPISSQTQASMEAFRDRSSELLDGLVVCTDTLSTLGEQFLQQTDQTTLEALQQQWQACFDLYRASTMLRGFTPEHRQAMADARSNLGKPLLMPGFIDSVLDYPYSGIVNDASLPLDKTSLRQQHGLTDEAEVSIGFPVVAFLLWGEQRQNPELGARPISDFEPASNWEDGITDLPIEEHPHNRRRRLLELTLELLSEDSQSLLEQWQSGAFPASQEAADSWNTKQVQVMKAALEQQPDNAQVHSNLAAWLADGMVPGVPAPIEPIDVEAEPEALQQQLSRALDTVEGTGLDTELNKEAETAPTTEPG